MTFPVPEPVDVEVAAPNARTNPIHKVGKDKWGFSCPICGHKGQRKLGKPHNLRKGRTAAGFYGISKPCETRKHAKDAFVVHVRNSHGAGLVGVRLR